MHWELNYYQDKRKRKRELRKQREQAPPTKTMMKKLGLTKKTSKLDHMRQQQVAYNTAMANLSPEQLKEIQNKFGKLN